MLTSFILLILSIQSPLWPMDIEPERGDPFIIMNKATNELAFFQYGDLIELYDVASGKEPELTPEGTFTVVVKAENPYYRKSDIIGGAPTNPLGTRWIGFDALETDGRIYGMHGTNEPESIKQYVSNGCIRMQNEQVEQLYDDVPLGTKIWITSKVDKTILELGAEVGIVRSSAAKSGQ
ncbi:L,D-transpeptidase [Geomicrobium sediminis]|uniref:Lipoprotein-anchoring transpeptidase ErfK/SrfK n=1 Tax=Geomicrobium sediminis TaxID=1347788 RepID=A0ABS2PDX3_9BACL|nr:L,D-transpeptidase [Geomicrobium sediminis]MBM7633622.1 lipoprotein-anchoring transpeptidase ErfK/SrfK [Geomicrobium sediminis]